MQENRIDGSQIITKAATPEDIIKAVNDPRNESVYIHKPGSIIKLKDGTEYRVDAKGTLHKIASKGRNMKPKHK